MWSSLARGVSGHRRCNARRLVLVPQKTRFTPFTLERPALRSRTGVTKVKGFHVSERASLWLRLFTRGARVDFTILSRFSSLLLDKPHNAWVYFTILLSVCQDPTTDYFACSSITLRNDQRRYPALRHLTQNYYQKLLTTGPRCAILDL
jgi:hypothetical protein